jgi:hypothetical protein
MSDDCSALILQSTTNVRSKRNIKLNIQAFREGNCNKMRNTKIKVRTEGQKVANALNIYEFRIDLARTSS